MRGNIKHHKSKNWIIGLITITIIVYLIFSFIHLTFDFTVWENRWKIGGITLTFFIFWSLIYGMYMKTNDDEK